MKFLPLPSGDSVNLDDITYVERDGETRFQDGKHWFPVNTDVPIIRAALNAPIKIETFSGHDGNPDTMLDLVQEGVNQFLTTLQPWQVISIIPQSSVALADYGAVTLHTITVVYRDLPN